MRQESSEPEDKNAPSRYYSLLRKKKRKSNPARLESKEKLYPSEVRTSEGDTRAVVSGAHSGHLRGGYPRTRHPQVRPSVCSRRVGSRAPPGGTAEHCLEGRGGDGVGAGSFLRGLMASSKRPARKEVACRGVWRFLRLHGGFGRVRSAWRDSLVRSPRPSGRDRPRRGSGDEAGPGGAPEPWSPAAAAAAAHPPSAHPGAERTPLSVRAPALGSFSGSEPMLSHVAAAEEGGERARGGPGWR